MIYLFNDNVTGSNAGAGIWSGIPFALMAAAGIDAVKKPTKCRLYFSIDRAVRMKSAEAHFYEL